jgi:hypothetical protein
MARMQDHNGLAIEQPPYQPSAEPFAPVAHQTKASSIIVAGEMAPVIP